jgi:hypothetical protein
MGFNLYFAGSQAKEADDLIEEKNMLRLHSYLHEKKQIQRRADKGFKTFVDSGAYSAHTKGTEIDVDTYIEYVNAMDDNISIFAQLDKIPGEFRKPKTKEQLRDAPEQSWENYLYMVERVKSPEKLLPIFHQGEDFKHLKRILEHEPKVEYMGISPANDMATSAKAVWIERCFEIIKKSSNPNIKTHAFGMTSLKYLERFPFTSADSTSWIMTAATGGIMSSYGVITVSDRATKDPKHIFNMPNNMREKLKEEIESLGFDLKSLSEDYKQRLRWNVTYLHNWAENYEYKPRKYKQKSLF